MNKTDKHNVSLGTLYDFNKQIMLQQKNITKSDLETKKATLEDWFNQQLDEYAMLLCRERYDFTVFHLYSKLNPNPPKIAVSELIDLLKERGTILSIEKDNTNTAWEIWIKINNEAFLYYLFNCDDWVIQC